MFRNSSCERLYPGSSWVQPLTHFLSPSLPTKLNTGTSAPEQEFLPSVCSPPPQLLSQRLCQEQKCECGVRQPWCSQSTELSPGKQDYLLPGPTLTLDRGQTSLAFPHSWGAFVSVQLFTVPSLLGTVILSLCPLESTEGVFCPSGSAAFPSPASCPPDLFQHFPLLLSGGTWLSNT